MSTLVRCPACGAFAGFRRSQARGLWEKSLRKIVGIKAYRCEACERRLLRRWLPLVEDRDPRHGSHDGTPQAPLTAKQPSDEFDELIRQISAAERRNRLRERDPR